MKTVEINLGMVGQPTRTGRVYPKEVMERALKERLAEDKPPLWVTDRNAPKLELRNVIGEVKDAQVGDDVVIGQVQILETTRGKHIIEMIESGRARIVGNPTGFGVTKRKDGVETVMSGYELEYFTVEAVEDEPTK